MSYKELNVIPDILLIQTEEKWITPKSNGNGVWNDEDIQISAIPSSNRLQIDLQAEITPVKRILARWKCDFNTSVKILGDHWERGYGDLEWRGIVHERILPWYFLMIDDSTTNGYGVKTAPSALCYWQVSEAMITLVMDVRCGAVGVTLHGQKLQVAEVISRKGLENESSFASAKAFCKELCDHLVMPSFPVYGGNNWYYAYGRSSHEEILNDSKRISEWASSNENRPFMVIDAGWQGIFINGESCSGAPWSYGNAHFPHMDTIAKEMKEIGVRPGIWCRPLLTSENVPEHWLLSSDRFATQFPGRVLDPSIPEVLAHIAKDMSRFQAWGFELIKHDFSTFDIFGRWGFEMGGQLTDGNWSFADRSKTTAQIIRSLYKTIFEAANGALIIGCNTIGHLGTGYFHLQRTGDDTSGQEWERTRKMGVNTLAFRMPQQDTFFASDADCVGLTTQVPWALNKQWLELLAKSGTPLFISAAPDALGEEQVTAIKEAFKIASTAIPAGEPMDWLNTTCPSKWILNEKDATFKWDDTKHPSGI